MRKFEEEGGPTPRPERNFYEVHVHVHGLQLGGSDPAIAATLGRIEAALAGLKTQGAAQTQEIQKMAGEIEALEAEVARNTTVDGSIMTLVTGLAGQIEALKNDPVRLQALVDKLRADNDAIVAKVLEHTPAAPA